LFELAVWCLKHVNMCGKIMSKVLIKKYWRENMSLYWEVSARVWDRALISFDLILWNLDKIVLE